MKKEILPEMLNYNKFPGPEFVVYDNNCVRSEQLEFLLIDNFKDAFNTKAFNQRYTDILLKYDYIVGDWGNEQLRLRGFYKDANDIKKSSRISRLDDYLKEFCNFGCAYFVLENPNPVEIKFEEEKNSRRKKTNRYPKKDSSKKTLKNPKVKDKTKVKPKAKDKEDLKKIPKPTSKFARRKRKENPNPEIKSQASKTKTPDKQANDKTGHFIIRKKDK
ncbi:YutD-like domain-containing protein [Streptococcus didelphis]|uniref:YutD-like domain-containing protein n=1 Tax=Streptococcus didelphis TaxID=102886 RepID=UPI00035EA9F2|nr:YutD-like domain-containing protein [Streptococcus didelphis]